MSAPLTWVRPFRAISFAPGLVICAFDPHIAFDPYLINHRDWSECTPSDDGKMQFADDWRCEQPPVIAAIMEGPNDEKTCSLT